jgi:DNA-binding CsgD family transcriptional regulator
VTPAEFVILKGIVNGMSSKEIAAGADRSVYTVEEHIQNLLNKFDARSRPQLSVLAAFSGIIGVSDLGLEAQSNGYFGGGVTTMSTSRTFDRL